ncbi:hypothetical protein P3342_003464 [Pyrenophora teres f. teres]|nr:hypothetical protein P3342_003464 [Pyrenophora teres f. teres]
MPLSQRRLHGHVKTGVTKKGNKKRGLRARAVSLLEDDESSEDEDDEDEWFWAVVDLLRRLVTFRFGSQDGK